MLVLTRWKGESLYIGDDIIITVLSVKGDLVRIGIDAPKDIPVHREGVYKAIAAQKLEKDLENERSPTAFHKLSDILRVKGT